MNKILLFIIFLLISGFAFGQTTITEQDFDTGNTWSYSSDVPFFDNGWNSDGYYGIINITDASPLDYINLSGNILGENDLDDEDNGTTGFATTTFASTDVSNFTSVVLTFDYDVEGYNANNDDATYVLVYDNADQTDVFLLDGNGAPVDAEGIITINVPGGISNVGLKIKIRNNGVSGYSGFDNFKIEGTAVGSLIGFDNATSSQNETDATFNVNIPITLSDYSSDVDLSITVSGGTTAEVGDYVLNTSSLSFTGNGTQNVSIDINDDADTDDEVIELTIAETTATGVIISTSLHRLTIVDDECSISTVAVTSTSCNGDNAEFVITWTVLNGSGAYEVDIDGNGYQTLASGGTYIFTGPTTPATGVTVTVRDVNEITCMGTTTVDIPECPVVLPQIVITEVADPVDDINKRMIEVCNRGASVVEITGWKLNVDFNGNTTVNATVDVLGSITLNASECYVFANFNFPGADLSACAGSTLSGDISTNGDESFWLNDGSQDVDFYDGQILNFEDEKATRNSTVTTPTPIFNSSEWTISAATAANITPCSDAVLPIELISFTATPKEKSTQINWTTSSELNNDYMAIERSTDSKNFQEIGMVFGAGTTDERQEYSFVDDTPFQGFNYYRLRQVDYDGTINYSKIVTVEFEQINNDDISIYPNPTTDALTIKFPENWEGETVISVLNGLGQVVKVINEPTQTFSVIDLPTGIYNLQVTNGRQSVSKFFVKG